MTTYYGLLAGVGGIYLPLRLAMRVGRNKFVKQFKAGIKSGVAFLSGLKTLFQCKI